MNWRQQIWARATKAMGIRFYEVIPKRWRVVLWPLRLLLFPIEMFNMWRARGHPYDIYRDGYNIHGGFISGEVLWALADREWHITYFKDTIVLLAPRKGRTNESHKDTIRRT